MIPDPFIIDELKKRKEEVRPRPTISIPEYEDEVKKQEPEEKQKVIIIQF